MKSPSQTRLGLSQWRVQMTGLNEPLATPIQAECSAGVNARPTSRKLNRKPLCGLAAADAPFDDVRWYRASYSEWLIGSCP